MLCLLAVEAQKGNMYGEPCLRKMPFYLLAGMLCFARPKHSAVCNALWTVSAPQVLKPTINHWQGQHCSLQAPACHPQPSLVLHKIAHQVLMCYVHCLVQFITFLVALLVQFIPNCTANHAITYTNWQLEHLFYITTIVGGAFDLYAFRATKYRTHANLNEQYEN